MLLKYFSCYPKYMATIKLLFNIKFLLLKNMKYTITCKNIKNEHCFKNMQDFEARSRKQNE